MLRSLTCLLLLLAAATVHAQKISFKPKLKVFINESANPGYQVKFIDPKKDTLLTQEAKTFSATGQLISYQLTEKLNWEKAKTLHKDSAALPKMLADKDVLYADIKPGEGRLMVYFWPFTPSDSATSKFLKGHRFSIALEERVNLSFRSSNWHAGLLTLPIKVYAGGADSVSAVQAGVSIGLYIGKKWSKTKYVKLPNEEEWSTYQSAWSLNAVLGLNKLDLDEANTTDGGKHFKGGMASLSAGIAPGFHYKTFTVFVATGFDVPLGSKGKYWAFKGKPWFGVGAGFEIF